MKENDPLEIEIAVEDCLPHEFGEFYRSHTTEEERTSGGPIQISSAPLTAELPDGLHGITQILLVLGSSGALAVIGKILCEWLRSGRTLYAIKDRRTGRQLVVQGKRTPKLEKAVINFLNDIASNKSPPLNDVGNNETHC